MNKLLLLFSEGIRKKRGDTTELLKKLWQHKSWRIRQSLPSKVILVNWFLSTSNFDFGKTVIIYGAENSFKLSTIYLLDIENPEDCVIFVLLTWILDLKYNYSYFSKLYLAKFLFLSYGQKCC